MFGIFQRLGVVTPSLVLTGIAFYCFVIMALDGGLIFEKFVMDKLTVINESKPARFTIVKVNLRFLLVFQV